MASKTLIGNVGMSGTTTGPHIHQYVLDLKTGQYIDPRTLMSPLLNVLVGEKETPLAIKDASGKIVFNPAAGATVTSEFGPRAAPTKGASTNHGGRDIALPYGTPVKYLGPARFTPKAGVQGFGNLGTLVTPDQRYEIGFGHMSSLGKPADFLGAQQAAPPAAQTLPGGSNWEDVYNASQQRTNDLLEAFMYGAKFGKGSKEERATPKSFLDRMKEQLIGSMLGGASESPIGMNIQDINQQVMSSVFG